MRELCDGVLGVERQRTLGKRARFRVLTAARLKPSQPPQRIGNPRVELKRIAIRKGRRLQFAELLERAALVVIGHGEGWILSKRSLADLDRFVMPTGADQAAPKSIQD